MDVLRKRMTHEIKDIAIKSEIRSRSISNPNFYKNWDIHSYRKPEFPTKYIDSVKEISKYDYFWNNQGYIYKD